MNFGILKSKTILIFSALVLFTYLVYWKTSIPSPTHHNHFVRLSESLLNGRLYLYDPPTYLELTGRDGDKIRYVAYPPMPAIVSIPFTYFSIFDKSQTGITILFASINTGLMYLVSKKYYHKNYIAVVSAILLAFGTNHWYLATEGSSWYMAHIIAVFFLLIALLALHYNWFFSGLALGAAYWSRLPSILALAFFISQSVDSLIEDTLKKTILLFKHNIQAVLLNKRIYLMLSGVTIFILANFFYNYVRFGTIKDIGYQKIQGVLEESWYLDGIFSLSYLPRNLEFFFFKLPLPHSEFPYYKPSLAGMSFFLTSPMFIFLIAIKWKQKIPLLAFLTGGLMLFPGLLHGTPGFSQFGYRFAMEATPFFLLALGSFMQRKWWWISVPFMLLAVAINFWGIYFIRTLSIY